MVFAKRDPTRTPIAVILWKTSFATLATEYPVLNELLSGHFDPLYESAEEESATEECDNLVNRPCEGSPLSTLVSWLVVANHFFGCLMVWAMLHDLAIAESVIRVLGESYTSKKPKK